MLVLSRKVGESIIINDNIVITVIKIERNCKVRLGLKAPTDIKIIRSELQSKEQNATDHDKQSNSN